MPTHYDILGVPNTAPLEEIKAVYTQLAFKYHPDKGEEADAERFRLVQEAYRVLSNVHLRSAYDQHLRESKIQGAPDIFLTPSSLSSSAAPVSAERSLVLRESFSLQELIKKAGGMSNPALRDMLMKANLNTALALLDNDLIVKKLAWHLQEFAPHFGKPFIDKILDNARIYNHLDSYSLWIIARFSAEVCLRVLNIPDLALQLNGKKLVELVAEFPSRPEILQAISANPVLHNKYQAYLHLLNYRAVAGPSNAGELAKILAWIRQAGIKRYQVTESEFKNAAVKSVLSSDEETLRHLDVEALNGLAEKNEKMALRIVGTPNLLSRLYNDSLGVLYLRRLCEKYHSVFIAVFENPLALEHFPVDYLFSLNQHYPGALAAKIAANPSVQKKYQAYNTLANYPCPQAIPDEKTEAHILTLLAETRLGGNRDSDNLLLTNKYLAWVLLKYGYIRRFHDKVIKNHPSLAPYLIKNYSSFPAAVSSKFFLEDLLNVSEAVCLQVLETENLLPLLNGKQLVAVGQKYGKKVFDKILTTPLLLDKCRAHVQLSYLTRRAGIRVEQGSKQFSESAEAKSNLDYERGLFLQEQGRISLAFQYFEKAIQADYEAAVPAIQNLALSVTPALMTYEEIIGLAKVFLDPKKPYHDESIAFKLYQTVFDGYRSYIQEARSEYETYCSAAYALYIRPWPRLGLTSSQSEKWLRDIYDKDQGITLLELCRKDLNDRRSLQQEIAVDAEPAILFIQAKMTALGTRNKLHQGKMAVALARLFHDFGFTTKAQDFFERAAAIYPSSLSKLDWFLLGSFQQSRVQGLPKPPRNPMLYSFLQASGFIRDAKLEKKARLQQETLANDARSLALSQIILIYQEGQSFTAENAALILADATLCDAIRKNDEAGPKVLEVLTGYLPAPSIVRQPNVESLILVNPDITKGRMEEKEEEAAHWPRVLRNIFLIMAALIALASLSLFFFYGVTLAFGICVAVAGFCCILALVSQQKLRFIEHSQFLAAPPLKEGLASSALSKSPDVYSVQSLDEDEKEPHVSSRADAQAPKLH